MIKCLLYVLLIGVMFFVVMSGFLADWTYGPKLLLRGWRKTFFFYARKVDRILLSAWVSMLVTFILDTAVYGPDSRTLRHGKNLLTCVVFFPQWSGEYTCPNNSTWTVGALFFAFLIYPCLNLLLFTFASSKA